MSLVDDFLSSCLNGTSEAFCDQFQTLLEEFQAPHGTGTLDNEATLEMANTIEALSQAMLDIDLLVDTEVDRFSQELSDAKDDFELKTWLRMSGIHPEDLRPQEILEFKWTFQDIPKAERQLLFENFAALDAESTDQDAYLYGDDSASSRPSSPTTTSSSRASSIFSSFSPATSQSSLPSRPPSPQARLGPNITFDLATAPAREREAFRMFGYKESDQKPCTLSPSSVAIRLGVWNDCTTDSEEECGGHASDTDEDASSVDPEEFGMS